MGVVTIRNSLRIRAIFVSRSFKEVFRADEGPLRVAAQHVLGDLRDFCFAEKTTFDPDAHVTARREGRREVWLRLSRYLNLDEAEVQTLMEIDDGQ